MCESLKVARVFSGAEQILWLRDVKFDNVLLLVSDTAKYMKNQQNGFQFSIFN
jgi:hypothetical protein